MLLEHLLRSKCCRTLSITKTRYSFFSDLPLVPPGCILSPQATDKASVIALVTAQEYFSLALVPINRETDGQKML